MRTTPKRFYWYRHAGAARTKQPEEAPEQVPKKPKRAAVPPVPPKKPNNPPSSSNVPPIPPFNPNLYPNMGGGNILPAAPVAAANRLPNPNPNTLNQFQERRHNGQAILAGILVGGLIEHIRHKRREKRMEKAHTKEVKELGKAQEATREQLRRQEIKGEETARKKTALERQMERLQKAPTELIPLAAPSPETAPIESHILTASKAEKTAKVESAIRPAERPKVEKELSEAETAIKKAQEAVERAHQNIELPPELPPDRKVETSAWHRIEIDKKTGNAVKDPTLEYGEEYHHEQHQEQLRKAADTESSSGNKLLEQYSPFQTLPLPANTEDSKVKKALPQGKLPLRDQATQTAKDFMQNANPVDIGLWVVLIIVIMLIIAVL
jgi:hypothetical protein